MGRDSGHGESKFDRAQLSLPRHIHSQGRGKKKGERGLKKACCEGTPGKLAAHCVPPVRRDQPGTTPSFESTITRKLIFQKINLHELVRF